MTKNRTMLSEAIVIATIAHNGQLDKGGNPYILHPLKVMHYLRDADEELQCVAVLHDVIEDTNVTFNDLRTANISERVIDAVRALTKMPGEGLDEYKARVFANKDAMRVKMADLRHNTDIRRLKGVTEKDIQRTVKYQQFYTELKERVENNQ